MKSNYNPFTVPENFFEDNSVKAMTRFGRFRRKVIVGFSAVAAALVLIAVPLSIKLSDNKQEVAENSLAQMYEYDIFLEVNF